MRKLALCITLGVAGLAFAGCQPDPVTDTDPGTTVDPTPTDPTTTDPTLTDPATDPATQPGATDSTVPPGQPSDASGERRVAPDVVEEPATDLPEQPEQQ